MITWILFDDLMTPGQHQTTIDVQRSVSGELEVITSIGKQPKQRSENQRLPGSQWVSARDGPRLSARVVGSPADRRGLPSWLNRSREHEVSSFLGTQFPEDAAVGIGHELLDADRRISYPTGPVLRSRGDSSAVRRPRYAFNPTRMGPTTMISAPESPSHIRTVRSIDAVVSCRPSGDHATPTTQLSWPCRTASALPFSASQIRPVWSCDAVASRRPSGDHVTPGPSRCGRTAP